MGVDTKVQIAGNVSVEAVVEVLRTELGIEATDHTTTKTNHYEDGEADAIFLGKEGEENCLSGFISFEYKGDKRNLFYHHSDMVWVDRDRLEQAIKLNAIELAGEVTHLSLGFDDNAVEILTVLAKHFGGYIDENDCDDIYYHKVTE